MSTQSDIQEAIPLLSKEGYIISNKCELSELRYIEDCNDGKYKFSFLINRRYISFDEDKKIKQVIENVLNEEPHQNLKNEIEKLKLLTQEELIAIIVKNQMDSVILPDNI